jgi:hypothetical protein
LRLGLTNFAQAGLKPVILMPLSPK